MKPTDFISFIALFLSIFATIFSAITFVKELEIEEHIKHLHKHSLNITSILRLDQDISHLFRTLGMEDKRADRLRRIKNAGNNATANSTEGERRLAKTDYGIFRGNSTSEITTPPTGKPFNESKGKD